MTTTVRIRTNGDYVSELRDAAGNVVGSAGPGSSVESGEITVPHGSTMTLTERDATDDEKVAAKPAE